MVHYVAGFIFDGSLDHVALIQGTELLALGGVVGLDESAQTAIARSVFEATSFPTQIKEWKAVIKLTAEDYDVTYFASRGPIRDLKSTTDAPIVVFGLDCISDRNTNAGLTWKISLARLVLQGKAKTVIVREV